jgi:hypothetical protein
MRFHFTMPRALRALAAVFFAMLATACTSVSQTGSSRSGTEQLLLTGAWDSALGTVDFSPLAGRHVYVDPDYVTVNDKEWILSSIRRALVRQGVFLQNNKDKADVMLEPALGAYGTDQRDCTSGLPPIGITPSMFGPTVSGGSTSSTSLNFTQSKKQDAVVKAAFFAYDAKTGVMLWESGEVFDAQGVRDQYFFGSGPYRASSVPDAVRYPNEAQRRSRFRWFYH